MADQLQAIKRRMKSVGSTERITNAMKLVSAAKLKQASRKYEYIQKNLGPVVEGLKTAIKAVGIDTPEIDEDAEPKTLYLAITGSRGLCGSYNMSICKALKELEAEEQNCSFLPMGTKGRDFCIRENSVIYNEGIREYTEEIPYNEIKVLADELLQAYKLGKFTELKVVYAGYINSISYEVRVKNLLPLTLEKSEDEGVETDSLVEYEPTGPEMKDYLAKTYLELQIYNILCEAAVCEHGARRLAMKNASDNAEEMLAELSVYYNRARQAAITNEIVEIIAGSEAQR